MVFGRRKKEEGRRKKEEGIWKEFGRKKEGDNKPADLRSGLLGRSPRPLLLLLGMDVKGGQRPAQDLLLQVNKLLFVCLLTLG